MAARFGTLLLGAAFIVLSMGMSAADDRLGVRPGMGIAEVNKRLKSLCDDLGGNPYVTCIRGTTVITVTMSAKDRAYYIGRWEVSPLPREEYAAQVAAELGFTGPGAECTNDTDEMQRCWHADDGTTLFAAETDTSTNAPKDRYAIFLVNDRIKEEDGAP